MNKLLDLKPIVHRKSDSIRLLERAIEVAAFYGFRPHIELKNRHLETRNRRMVCLPLESCFALGTRRRQYTILETYISAQESAKISETEPRLLYYYTNPSRIEEKVPLQSQFNLEIFGIQGSIGEALIIRTALSILEEISGRALLLTVNSIGDRESAFRFIKDASRYYRKHNAELHTSCRATLRKNIWGVLSCGYEQCVAVQKNSPQTITYLSERSRQHFKSVLEFLEAMGASYEIDKGLAPDTDLFSETIFEIKEAIAPETIAPIPHRIRAWGGRYNYAARRIGSRKDIHAVGISIALEMPIHRSAAPLIPAHKPKVYFIQLGYEAVRKSFPVLEILRKRKIPLLQTQGAHQLIGQLSIAEKLAIPYTMIIGQREAVDDTVIVRHTDTRKQETVPVGELATYLLKLPLRAHLHQRSSTC